MDSVIFIGLIVLTVIVVVGLPIGLPFFILWIVKKRNYDRRLKLIALIPIVTIGFIIYTSFYPPDSFYKEDFKEVTGIEFPENGKIMYKTATYPDQFGDYGSTAIIKVDKEFYSGLVEKIKEKGLTDDQPNDDMEISEPFDYDVISNKIGTKTIEKKFSKTADGGIFYYVGFLSDKETLIVQRQSW